MAVTDERQSSHAERWAERRLSGSAMRPRDAAYVIAAVWLVAVVAFGVIERLADPKTFKSVWLGFWWAVETVTTVGYGDVVPAQASGKFLAAILMLGGLSLLSVVTATITSAFVARRQEEQRAAGKDPVMQQLVQISDRLDRLEADLRTPRPDPRTPDGGDQTASS